MYYKMGKPQSHKLFLKFFFCISSHCFKNSLSFILNIFKVTFLIFRSS